MFGRFKNVGITYNSFDTVEIILESSDSEDTSRIHTPPTVLIRYVTPLIFMWFIQYTYDNQ